jgi:hypothetical protein
MPRWLNDIPQTHPYAGVPLLRTPATGSIAGHCLSDRIVGTNTHYAQGRTQPCEHPHCAACAAKLPFRYHAYFAILLDRNQKQAVVEVTAPPAHVLVTFRAEHGSLRGVHITLTRPRRTPNGRVHIQLSPGQIAPSLLPQPVDAILFMTELWNIAARRLQEQKSGDGKPHLHVGPETADLLENDGLTRLFNAP